MTPFGAWSFDLTEAAAAELLERMPSGSVLVSHSPPKGLLDRDSRGRSLGSEAIRSAVEKLRPPLVVCGHIHASGGQKLRWLDSEILNAGPKGVFYVAQASSL